MTTVVVPHRNGHVADPGRRGRIVLYVVLAVLFLGLAGWGLAAYRGHTASQQALAKAAQLQQRFRVAGLPTFTQEGIARTLGADGGAVCKTSGKDLASANLKLMLSNGAAGPGLRPVLTARRVLLGELLVVRTYCPERLADFRAFVDGLQFRNVIRAGGG
jgi:hypothetical protein